MYFEGIAFESVSIFIPCVQWNVGYYMVEQFELMLSV